MNKYDETVFSGKKAVFLGDSLTEINQHYTKGYHSWICEILGLESYENYGISGTPITAMDGMGFCERYKQMTDDADLVVVMGGTNDCLVSAELGTPDSTDNKTVYGAVNTLCGGLKKKYPDAILFFITPHYQTAYPHEKGYTADDISAIIIDVCSRYQIPVYDNNRFCGINESNLEEFTVDGCHWNDRMHEIVGKNIAAWMKETFCKVQ